MVSQAIHPSLVWYFKRLPLYIAQSPLLSRPPPPPSHHHHSHLQQQHQQQYVNLRNQLPVNIIPPTQINRPQQIGRPLSQVGGIQQPSPQPHWPQFTDMAAAAAGSNYLSQLPGAPGSVAARTPQFGGGGGVHHYHHTAPISPPDYNMSTSTTSALPSR